MNIRVLVKIMVFCLFMNSLFGQNCDLVKLLKLDLIIDKDNIGHLDLLEYTIKVSNITDADIEIIEPWSSFHKPKLEYRFNNDSIWKTLQYSDKGTRSFMNPPWRDIKYQRDILIMRKSIIDKSFLWAPFLLKKINEEYFTASDMFLRAQIYPCNNNIPLISNEVIVSFFSYKNIQNLKAYNLLISKNTPGYIYEIVAYGFNSWSLYSLEHLETISDAEELVSKYPGTDFADWGRLHLALCYYYGIHNVVDNIFQPDYEKVKSLLTELKNVDSEYIQKIRLILLDEVDFDPFRE